MQNVNTKKQRVPTRITKHERFRLETTETIGRVDSADGSRRTNGFFLRHHPHRVVFAIVSTAFVTACGSTPSNRANNDECYMLESEHGPDITITVQNTRDSSVFLGDRKPGCSREPQFLVFDINGVPVMTASYSGRTCNKIASGETYHSFESCPPAWVTELQAGGQVTYVWPGVIYQSESLPSHCGLHDELTNCLQEKSPAGTYAILVKGSSASIGKAGDELEAWGTIDVGDVTEVTVSF
jgi:hypothetical protein